MNLYLEETRKMLQGSTEAQIDRPLKELIEGITHGPTLISYVGDLQDAIVAQLFLHQFFIELIGNLAVIGFHTASKTKGEVRPVYYAEHIDGRGTRSRCLPRCLGDREILRVRRCHERVLVDLVVIGHQFVRGHL